MAPSEEDRLSKEFEEADKREAHYLKLWKELDKGIFKSKKTREKIEECVKQANIAKQEAIDLGDKLSKLRRDMH
ncbi:MAG: hypothetical protein GY797_39425 [Deltaproteobacteria bacterium]|nr:hypothetical protein [Deltaproteobacteria bacterium]